MAPSSKITLRVLVYLLGLVGLSFAQSYTGDQYKKALWMATRYLGAQRSGTGPNWILQQTGYPTSFVKDSYNGQDVSGGWFDCGDHVMFGQTQYYAAYVIAHAVETYPYAWWDLYDGSYADYKASGDYSINGGVPNGIPDIIEELRYEADFVVKATPDYQTFIFMKGDGTKDHLKWTHAGYMSTLTIAKGGESDGSRAIAANPNDAYAPGMAAAFLAVMGRIDPDATRRALYIAHAINAYRYSLMHSGVQSSGAFYMASSWDGRWVEGRALGGWEIYRTTGDLNVFNYAVTDYNAMKEGIYSRMEYANAVPLARLVMEPVLGPTYLNLATSNYLQLLRDSLNPQGVTTRYNMAGFATRGPISAAYLEGMYDATNGITEHTAFTFKQIDYILGANNTQQSYMVGWDEGSAIDVSAPHHRGFWLNEDIVLNNNPTNYNALKGPTGTKYLGAVIGGALDGSYIRDVVNYKFNEPCIDMNATWIGALAYAVQTLKPTATPLAKQTFVRVAGLFRSVRAGNEWVFSSLAKRPLAVSIVDIQGRAVATLRGSSELRWTLPTSGIYQAIIRDDQGHQQSVRIQSVR